MSNLINHYLTILENNILLSLLIKVILFFVLFVMIFIIRGVYKRLFGLFIFLIYILVLIMFESMSTIILTFIGLIVLFTIVNLFLFFKENEKKLIIINKLGQNIKKNRYISKTNDNNMKKIIKQNKNKILSNSDNYGMADNDIINLYNKSEKLKYNYKVYTNFKSVFQNIYLFIFKLSILNKIIIVDIKIILIILVLYNSYILFEFLDNILSLHLYFKII